MLIYGNLRCHWGWLHHWTDWFTHIFFEKRERFCKKCGATDVEWMLQDIIEPEVFKIL